LALLIALDTYIVSNAFQINRNIRNNRNNSIESGSVANFLDD